MVQSKGTDWDEKVLLGFVLEPGKFCSSLGKLSSEFGASLFFIFGSLTKRVEQGAEVLLRGWKFLEEESLVPQVIRCNHNLVFPMGLPIALVTHQPLAAFTIQLERKLMHIALCRILRDSLCVGFHHQGKVK